MFMNENIYSRGGLRIGTTYWNAENYTWPFIKLYFMHEKLCLERIFPIKRWEIAAQEIVAVKRVKGIISCLDGYQIEHTSTHLPPVVIFWSCGDLKLKKKFYFWLKYNNHISTENPIKLLF